MSQTRLSLDGFHSRCAGGYLTADSGPQWLTEGPATVEQKKKVIAGASDLGTEGPQAQQFDHLR